MPSLYLIFWELSCDTCMTLREFSVHPSRRQTSLVSCGFRFQAPHGFQFVGTLPVAALLSKNPRLRIRNKNWGVWAKAGNFLKRCNHYGKTSKTTCLGSLGPHLVKLFASPHLWCGILRTNGKKTRQQKMGASIVRFNVEVKSC